MLKQECKDNPWIQVDFVGKDAKRVEKPLTIPYTKEGFAIFAVIVNGIQSKVT